LNGGSEPILVLKEELFHTAQPRCSPHGETFVYVGQESGETRLRLAHNLHGNSSPLLPLLEHAYTPTWSPDATQIAFVGFVDNHLALKKVNLLDGKCNSILIVSKQYKIPFGVLRLSLIDGKTKRPTQGRIYISASDGKHYSPNGGIHRQTQATGDHYSYCDGSAVIEMPAGNVSIEALRGFEYRVAKETISIPSGGTAIAEIILQRFSDLNSEGWYSGDTHCHLTYGGTIPRSRGRALMEASAEGLNIANVLVANRDNTMLDIKEFCPGTSTHPTYENVLLATGEEYRPMFSGHLELLGLTTPVLPSYCGYRGTAHAADYPSNNQVLDLVRLKGGIGGYAHPFYLSGKDPQQYDYQGAREFPANVALGTVSYFALLCIWSFESATTNVWYRLLNVGSSISGELQR
jgi:hypothetical protein